MELNLSNCANISLAIGVFLLSATYCYFRHAFTYWEKIGVPTLEPTFPFGNMFRVLLRRQSVNDKVREVYDTFKDRHRFAGLYFFSRKVLVALDPHLIKCILAGDFQHFNDRGIYYDERNDPISAHLFSLSGSKWRKLRAKLSPAFTPAKTKGQFGAIIACAEEMVGVLLGAEGDVVEIKELLARFSTDVIGSCAFGIRCNSLRNPDAEFRQMGKRAFLQTPRDVLKMVIIRSFPQIARSLRLSVFARSVSTFFRDVVADTVDFRERHNISRPDFLQLLMQLKNEGRLEDEERPQQKSAGDDGGRAQERLTSDEIAAQAFIFFLAGFETTSATISFALLEMALNPQVQHRARAELGDVLSKHSGKFTNETIADLHYLEMVVLESLRKYPPAPVFLRKCTQNYNVPGTEIVIEKGLSTLIPAMALHRDPKFYPDPERFDPERFNKENKQNIKDYTYLPFGEGPRICIGKRFAMLQAKIALALITHNFSFTLSERTALPLKMENKGIVLTPIGGVWLKFHKL